MKSRLAYGLAGLMLGALAIVGTPGCASQRIQEKTKEYLESSRQSTSTNSFIRDTSINPLQVYEEGTQITYLADSARIAIPINYVDANYIVEMLSAEEGKKPQAISEPPPPTGDINRDQRNQETFLRQRIISSQLENGISLTSAPITNQVIFRIPYSSLYSSKEAPPEKRQSDIKQRVATRAQELEEIVASGDILPAQFRVEAHIYRIFAANVNEASAQINTLFVHPKPGELTNFGINIGSENGSSQPDTRITLGGLIDRGIGTYEITATMEKLQRKGYVSDLGHAVFITESGHRANISDVAEIRIPEQTVVGGAIRLSTEPVEVRNFFEVTPYARLDGIINMIIDIGVAEVISTGSTEETGEDVVINRRQIEISSAHLLAGQTLVIGGFENSRELGTATGGLIGSGVSEEQSLNRIVYFITVEYLDVLRQLESNPDAERLRIETRQDGQTPPNTTK